MSPGRIPGVKGTGAYSYLESSTTPSKNQRSKRCRKAPGGASWKRHEGIPFGSIHRLHFDPRDSSKIAVTTFAGGVWKGPAFGAPYRIAR